MALLVLPGANASQFTFSPNEHHLSMRLQLMAWLHVGNHKI